MPSWELTEHPGNQPTRGGTLTQPAIEDCNALLALFRAGRLVELEARAQALLAAHPDAGFLWKMLAAAQRQQGKASFAAFARAVALLPEDPEAHWHLGLAHKGAGRPDEAIASYRRALALRPDYAEALLSLGNALADLGRLEEAVAAYQAVLRLRPELAEAHNNLGNALRNLGALDDAAGCFRRALELRPQFALALANLALVEQNLGRLEAAAECYRRAFALQPGALQHAFHAALLLPVIPRDRAEIARWRERFQRGLGELARLPGTLAEPARDLDACTFYLAYHDADDRPLLEALARLLREKAPQLAWRAPQLADWRPPEDGRRIRVGFLSEYLVEHTIGKHYQGFIRHLDRRRFEVVVIHAAKSRHDAFSAELDAAADGAIRLPAMLAAQQQAVAAAGLDVLFYPDIGMSPATYCLAHARLAPVQLTSWGHPDTSGLPEVDYYLSSVLNEPAEADARYSERLVRLSRLPCCYARPPAAAPSPGRAALGLPEAGTLYGCPQNLFKLHPDFDAVLAGIAAGDPAGHILIPEGNYPAWTRQLQARWAQTVPALAGRVRFLPRMPWTRFMATLAEMDVLLDPLHFGSGNTLYDAMAFGVPVVTWPGRFARGRNVAAAYRQMGIGDAPVAATPDDYAATALALGRNPERLAGLRRRLQAAAADRLFADFGAVRELETFLVAAVDAAGRGGKLPVGWQPAVVLSEP